jgi:hypothetical protein
VRVIELEAGGRRVCVEVGAHACQLSATGADADRTAWAFLRDGIRADERCVALVSASGADSMCAHLAADGIDPDDALAARQLVFDSTGRAVTSLHGFDPYSLVARHLTDFGALVASGGSRLRILVDMHWYAGASRADALLRYEATCHAAMAAHSARVVVLAQYRYADLPDDAVIDMLRLHPSTVVAQYVRRNPNPADPVSYMARLLNRVTA